MVHVREFNTAIYKLRDLLESKWDEIKPGIRAIYEESFQKTDAKMKQIFVDIKEEARNAKVETATKPKVAEPSNTSKGFVGQIKDWVIGMFTPTQQHSPVRS